jgi:hypothetical protein
MTYCLKHVESSQIELMSEQGIEDRHPPPRLRIQYRQHGWNRYK